MIRKIYGQLLILLGGLAGSWLAWGIPSASATPQYSVQDIHTDRINVPGFDTSLGTLRSVTVSTSFSGHSTLPASVFGNNPSHRHTFRIPMVSSAGVTSFLNGRTDWAPRGLHAHGLSFTGSLSISSGARFTIGSGTAVNYFQRSSSTVLWSGTDVHSHTVPDGFTFTSNITYRYTVPEIELGDFVVGSASVGMQSFDANGVLRGPFASLITRGIAFDGNGNLFATDDITKTVQRFDASGNLLSSIGAGVLDDPYRVAFDSAGNLYVADLGTDLIHKFDASGTQLGTIGTTFIGDPFDLAFDSAGNLYVGSDANGTIEKFDSSGVRIGSIVSGLSSGVRGLEVDENGVIYVSNGGDEILRFDDLGSALTSFIGAGSADRFRDLIFDADGILHATDSSGGRVYQFDSAGNSTILVTGLTNPHALAFQTVPEPSGITLATLSLLGLGCGCRKSRRTR